jgi:hypothetical protein
VPAAVALPELTIVREYVQRDRDGNLASARTLAAKYGVSVTPVYRILKEAGVMRVSWEDRKVQVPEATVVREYLEKDGEGNWVNTCQTLATKHGVSKKSIRLMLTKAGVARTSWQTRRDRPLVDGAREAIERGKAALVVRQALDCRMDPAWEARERITEVVYCRECLLPFSALSRGNRRGHLWGAHRLTVEQYHMKWPGARTVPFAHQARYARGGRQSGLEKIMATAAASYLAPPQLSECRVDIEWESKQENQDFWRERLACRGCGFVGSQCLLPHLRARHRWTKAQYRGFYPKAPTSSVEALGELRLRNEKIVKAWRPDGFDKWPLWQQRAGEYFLTNPGLRAPQVGKHLDRQNVPGPWGKSTAADYARTKAGEVAFYRVRKKLQRS